MTETTTIRISRATHEELSRMAAAGHLTIAETVSRAVRLLQQEQIGRELSGPLTDEGTAWLDADAG